MRHLISVATLAAALAGATGAAAQGQFRDYRCADGTQFVMGLFQYDSRAHLQLDGKALTLTRRLALSGTRYSGAGVSVNIGRNGATALKRPRRSPTACELT